nr:hypothetical protein [Kibdelosporangium sp. MJ126-NF4]
MATRDRRGSWFPLALLGFLALGSTAVSLEGWVVDSSHTSFPIGGQQFLYSGEFASLRGVTMSRAYEDQFNTSISFYTGEAWPSVGSAEYWVAGLSLVLLAAIAWYARGSGRAWTYLAAAVCGVVAIGAFSCTMWIVEESPDLAPTVAGSLLAIGLCAAGWVYFNLGRGRSTLTVISVMTSAVGVTGLLAAWTSYRADELLVAGGLVLLAWWERSWLVAALAGAILAIEAVPMPTLVQLVLVTGLLFAGAFVALLRRGDRTAPQ